MIRSALSILLASYLLAGPALAAADPKDGDIGDIKLGMTAGALSTDRYMDFACGTGGGPPGMPIRSWIDFKRCPRAADGLTEVNFRFDDEQEYIIRAHHQEDEHEALIGTKLAGQPVNVSVLFDAAGVVDGMRIQSDDRAETRDRKTANLLGVRLLQRYGEEDWTCTDTPPSGGRTPIGGTYLDRICRKSFNDDRDLLLTMQQYRNAGQTGVNTSGGYMPDEFVNVTTLLIMAKHPD